MWEGIEIFIKKQASFSVTLNRWKWESHFPHQMDYALWRASVNLQTDVSEYK
jgi:hypothetical protein